MIVFSIVNPSDPYTLVAPSLKIAAVATCIFGEGRYGLRQCDGHGDAAMPVFLEFGHETWFQRKFGETFEQALYDVHSRHREAMVRCLGSVLWGQLPDRLEIGPELDKLGVEARAQRLLEWHDSKRSSADDIGRRAWDYSNRLALTLQAQADDYAPAPVH